MLVLRGAEDKEAADRNAAKDEQEVHGDEAKPSTTCGSRRFGNISQLTLSIV